MAEQVKQAAASGEVVKYYTRARKFPMLLGRMPDGTKIPGGPYTVQQLLAAIGVLALGSMTMDMWGAFGAIGNVVVLFGAAFGAVFLIGRIPLNGRNPLLAAMGVYRLYNAPATGRYKGRAIRLRRPRQVTCAAQFHLGMLPGVDPAQVFEPELDTVAAASMSRVRKGGSRAQDVAAGDVQRHDAPRNVTAGPLTSVQALLALPLGAQNSRPNGRRVVSE